MIGWLGLGSACLKRRDVSVPLAQHMHAIYRDTLSSGRGEEDFFSVAAGR